jgi:hypothetical protein
MLAEYNHRSDAVARAPLPFLRTEYTPRDDFSTGEWTTLYTQVPRADDAPVMVRLDTDSEHAALFFSLNWQTQRAPSANDCDVRVVVRKHRAAHYGLPGVYDTAIMLDQGGRTAFITGSEYYTKLKTSLRVLCSVTAPPDQIYLYGCSVDIDGHGVLICGQSGTGKTTLVIALRQILGNRVRVVNDDWGPLSLRDFRTVYTGERHLHMKYRSVALLAPEFPTSPAHFPSECFSGNGSQPQARLLIERERAFGHSGVCDSTIVQQLWLLSRNDASAPFFRRLTQRDVSLFEQMPPTNGRDVQAGFINGAFLPADGPATDLQHMAHLKLLASGRVFLVNSFGDVNHVASQLIDKLLPREAPFQFARAR